MLDDLQNIQSVYFLKFLIRKIQKQVSMYIQEVSLLTDRDMFYQFPCRKTLFPIELFLLKIKKLSLLETVLGIIMLKLFTSSAILNWYTCEGQC